MLKLAFWGIIGYVAYRYWIKPKQIQEKAHNNEYRSEDTRYEKKNTEEYTDYEEVD